MTAEEQRPARQVIVTVNGPGEISGWLYPFARVLKRRDPGVRLCAAVLPSVFRAGSETRVLESLPEVDACAAEDETRRLIYRGRFPHGFWRNSPGCVLHLGGEPFLTYLLARRFGYPILFYGEGLPRPRFWYRKIFLTAEPKHPEGQGKRDKRVVPVGNLMVDAARMRCGQRSRGSGGSLTIGLFPGSRYYQVKHMLPFMLKVARLVRLHLEDARFLLAKADYLSLDTIGQMAAVAEGRLLEGDSALLRRGNLVSDRGLTVDIGPPERVMAKIDLALTVPGTNTAELSALGIPMMVLLPSQKPELYPMPGPAGHLHRLPLVGKYLKIALLWLFWKRVKYFAHPNRKTGRQIVPEVVGRVTAQEIARRLAAFSTSPLEETSGALKSIMGTAGAAGRLADEVLRFLNQEERQL
jgi:hypothetical protein